MSYLRILHNGDVRNGSPHWMVHVNENGGAWGELLTNTFSQLLKEEHFRLDDVRPFFQIPHSLVQKQLTAPPHHEEIILSLVEPSGKNLCSFLLSEIPMDSDLRRAVEKVVDKISDLAKQTH